MDLASIPMTILANRAPPPPITFDNSLSTFNDLTDYSTIEGRITENVEQSIEIK